MYPNANTYNEKNVCICPNCKYKVLTQIRRNNIAQRLWGEAHPHLFCCNKGKSFRCDVFRLLTPSLFCLIWLNKLCCILYVIHVIQI